MLQNQKIAKNPHNRHQKETRLYEFVQISRGAKADGNAPTAAETLYNLAIDANICVATK